MRGIGWETEGLETSEGWWAWQEAREAHAWGDTNRIGWAASAADPACSNHEAAMTALAKTPGGRWLSKHLEALVAREAKGGEDAPACRRDRERLARTLSETHAALCHASTASVRRSHGGTDNEWPIEAGPAQGTSAGVRIEGVPAGVPAGEARDTLAQALSLWTGEEGSAQALSLWAGEEASAQALARRWSASLCRVEGPEGRDVPLAWDACVVGARAARWVAHREMRDVAGREEGNAAVRKAVLAGDAGEAARAMLAGDRALDTEAEAATARWSEAVLGRRAKVGTEEARRVQRRLDACLLEGAGGALDAAAEALEGRNPPEDAWGPTKTGRALASDIEAYGPGSTPEERRALGAQAREYAPWAGAAGDGARSTREEEALERTCAEALARLASRWGVGRDGALHEPAIDATPAQSIAEEIEWTGEASHPYGVPLAVWAVVGRAAGPSAAVVDLPEGTLIGQIRRALGTRADNAAALAERTDAEETIALGNRLAAGAHPGWEPLVEDAKARRARVEAGASAQKPSPAAAKQLQHASASEAHDEATRAARRCVGRVHAHYARAYEARAAGRGHAR